jgi:hypothetical protein
MRTLFFSFLLGVGCCAQTTVDLGKQSKNVDFSNAPSTTPWKMGSTLPSTCRTGEVFFNTANNNGLNINICLNDAWVAFTGTLGSLPVQSGSAGLYLRTNGTNLVWSNIITGASGAIDCATLPGVCDISTALVPFKAVANSWTGANDFTASPNLRLRRGTGDPASGCSVADDVGGVYVRADGPADNNLWICENNGGTRRWRRPTDGIVIPDVPNSNNAFTGSNDFTASTNLRLRRGTGDPASGCSVAGDVGGVYVRADGPADNNLWICENNGGTRRWRRPTERVLQTSIQTVNRGHFWLGFDAGTSASGAFTIRQPRCWEFINPSTLAQLGTASAILDTVDAAGFATLAIYNSDDTLAGQSNTVPTTTAGLISFTFSTALTLSSGVYTACLATTSATAVFRASTATSGGTLLMRSLATPRLFTPANQATGTNPMVMPATLGSRTALGSTLFPVAILAEP